MRSQRALTLALMLPAIQTGRFLDQASAEQEEQVLVVPGSTTTLALRTRCFFAAQTTTHNQATMNRQVPRMVYRYKCTATT